MIQYLCRILRMQPVIIYPTIIRFPLERANGIQVVHTCHALSQLGCKVYLFVLQSSSSTDEEVLKFYGLSPSENLDIIRMPFLRSKSERAWNISAYISAFYHVHALLLKVQSPVILTRDRFMAQYFLPWLRRKKGKMIYECHHIEYMFRQELHTLYLGAKPLSFDKIQKIKSREMKVYCGVSGILAITEKLKNLIIEIFNPGAPVEVIRDGCVLNEESFEDSPPSSSSMPVRNLLYVGDMNPVKGVDVLVRAVKDIPGVRLTLAGGVPSDGSAARIKMLCDRLGLQQKVHFQGYVSPYNVRKLYKDADIVLLPLSPTVQSRYFTSPLKMFEYMASGKPIIAADFPSIKEVLTHGETAMLVPPEDEKAWAQAIHNLLHDEPLCEKISKNARQLSLQYTWEMRAKRILDFINLLS